MDPERIVPDGINAYVPIRKEKDDKLAEIITLYEKNVDSTDSHAELETLRRENPLFVAFETRVATLVKEKYKEYIIRDELVRALSCRFAKCGDDEVLEVLSNVAPHTSLLELIKDMLKIRTEVMDEYKSKQPVSVCLSF